MEKQTRRKFKPEFKAKVVLEALKERSTLENMAQKYEPHPNQILQWKKEAISKLAEVFDKKGTESNKDGIEAEKLYAQIGQLKVENDYLKKKLF